MKYVWTKDLEIGNTVIDGQHKMLVTSLNNLLDACTKGEGRKKLEETISFLIKYTVKHFADEELIQKKYAYPDYIRHKNEHQKFTETVSTLMDELKSNGPSVTLVARVNTEVGGWLINHIKVEDAKIAAHIKSLKK